MVGYSTNGYRLWYPNTNSIVVSRNIVFDEDTNIRPENGIITYDNGKPQEVEDVIDNNYSDDKNILVQ